MTMSKQERKTTFNLVNEAARLAWVEGYNAAAQLALDKPFKAPADKLRNINPYEPIDHISEPCS